MQLMQPHIQVDRVHETNRIGRMELKPRDLILVRRLKGWPLARSRLWPSFEARARGRSSGRRYVDMIRTSERRQSGLFFPGASGRLVVFK
jgi:hypothetical protein